MATPINCEYTSTRRNIFRAPVYKRIIVLLFIFVLLTLCVSFYFFLKSSDKPKDTTNYSKYVQFFNVNATLDPCSNFYDFTCSLWPGDIGKTLGSTDYFHNSFVMQGNIVQKRMKEIFVENIPNEEYPSIVNDALNYYQHCMDLQRNNISDINYLLKVFDNIGGWPILQHKPWKEENFYWMYASSYLLKNIDKETVLGLNAAVNDMDSSLNVLYIKLPSFEKKELFLDNYFAKQVLFTILYTLNPEIDDEHISDEMNDIQYAEAKWHQIFTVTENTEPVQMSFRELHQRIPQFDWLNYVHLVMNNSFNKFNIQFSENDVVMIENLDCFEKAFNMLQSNGSFTQRQLANLFGWFVVQDLFILIPGAIMNYAEANEDDINETLKVAEEQCFIKTLEIYECSIEYLFVQNTSHAGISDNKILVNYLKKSFTKAFISSNWLDHATTKAAIKKLNFLQTVLGFKEYYSNKTAFNVLYEYFPTASENVLETFFKIKKFFVTEVAYLLKHGNSFVYDPLPRPITDVSAYYILQRNVLVIPISMYDPPFYYKDAPWYLNFGALGTILGHEIMHAFDKLGCQRSEKGNLKSWWTNSSKEEYIKRSDCFEEQYSSYNSMNRTSEVLSTLNENIADSEGLQMAFLAYKLWIADNVLEEAYTLSKQYSPEQMFFIAFGSMWCARSEADFQNRKPDAHSIPELRVNGAVSNSEHFAHAFGCSLGSPMNPENKCQLW